MGLQQPPQQHSPNRWLPLFRFFLSLCLCFYLRGVRWLLFECVVWVTRMGERGGCENDCFRHDFKLFIGTQASCFRRDFKLFIGTQASCFRRDFKLFIGTQASCFRHDFKLFIGTQAICFRRDFKLFIGTQANCFRHDFKLFIGTQANLRQNSSSLAYSYDLCSFYIQFCLEPEFSNTKCRIFTPAGGKNRVDKMFSGQNILHKHTSVYIYMT